MSTEHGAFSSWNSSSSLCSKRLRAPCSCSFEPSVDERFGCPSTGTRIDAKPAPPPGRAVVPIQHGLHGLAPGRLHFACIAEPLIDIGGEDPSQPVGYLPLVSRQGEVAGNLPRAGLGGGSVAQRRRPAPRA